MPLVALALLLLVPLALIALTPLLLVQRYRTGSARRLARPWLATVNLASMLLSAGFFLFGAAITNIWIADAFAAAAAGLAVGAVLGVIGLWLTRWDDTPRSLHYTPNRWLVLAITLIVAARVLYGFWRGWESWHATRDQESLLAALGIASSLAAGGTVLGYYLAYALGLRRRIRRWQKRPLRVM